MNKAELRASQRQRLRVLSPESRARHSEGLCRRLRGDPRVRAATRIGIFLALPDEPDLSPFFRDALAEGKCLALPFPNAAGSWGFRQIHNLEERPSSHWTLLLPEPGDVIAPADLEVVLVPGRAFAPDGNRLGRGKGIYDRLLTGVHGLILGCGFPEQCVEYVPGEAHDIPVHEVWTGND